MKFVVRMVKEVTVETSDYNAAVIAAEELVKDMTLNDVDFDDAKYGNCSTYGKMLAYEERTFVDSQLD